ncbi:adenylate/guanylate cyclase domain-containing protein [Sneathiella glossodoripedis]|uniref:adenylate/guanylate cyclase domain-containing protein n=1 Tax=Sneathiella glossodoripedis TaxID=418853 RepID=UPI00046FC0A5|nr:adenylate/guanylate cyclase domain-containing protein [Sneathiella glossodoripedis]
MTRDLFDRRLAAIVIADVVGYSRLIAADEIGTLKRIRELQVKIFQPEIESFQGRLVKTMGDGFLLEFPSAVAAVKCIVNIQESLLVHEENIPKNKRIDFRVGINVGDIVVDGDDIQGDGVNVAARLEGIANPGSILVSNTVYEQVRDKLQIGFTDLGKVEVKNIPRPIQIFEVDNDKKIRDKQPVKQNRSLRSPMIIAAILLVIGIGFIGWSVPSSDFEPLDPTKLAYKIPDKPSIAVLPFENLTGEISQNFIADGLVENIIHVLASTPDIFIVSPKSVFAFKGKNYELKDAAEKFAVQYLLTGSVQHSNEHIRANIKLQDALNGSLVWSGKFDKKTEDLLSLQDDIAREVLVQMQAHLTVGLSVHPMAQAFGKDIESYQKYLRGLKLFQEFSKKSHITSEKIFEDMHKADPNNFVVVGMLSWIQWQKVSLLLTKNISMTMKKARKLAEWSIQLNPDPEIEYEGRALLAVLDLYELKCESAISNANTALDNAPSTAQAIALAGFVKGRCGQLEEGIRTLKHAMRVEPDYAHWIPLSLMSFLVENGKLEEAEQIAIGVLSSKSDDVRSQPRTYQLLALIAYKKGEKDKARRHINEVLNLDKEFSIATYKNRMYVVKNQNWIEQNVKIYRELGVPMSSPNN